MLSASWKDLIPRGRAAREDHDAVTGRVVAHVEHVVASGATCSRADSLVMPAEEIARILVIHGVHGPGDVSPLTGPCFRSLLSSAIDEVERGDATATALVGLMTFANAVVVEGKEVPGLCDRYTQRLFERERAWLGELAARAGSIDAKTRRLAASIAIAIRDDAHVLRFAPFASSIEQLVARPDDAEVYYDLVAAFPDSDLTWSELLFVARAFWTRVERQPQGIGASAAWLHKLVRSERPVRLPPAPRPSLPPPPELVQRAAVLFHTSEGTTLPRSPSIEWTSVELGHLHGLWGGHELMIRSDGAVVAKVRRGSETVSYEAVLSAAAFKELDALIATASRWTHVEPARLGVPDEMAASLTLVTPTARHRAWKWDRDVHEDFNRVRDWLDTAARALAATHTPSALPDPDPRHPISDVHELHPMMRSTFATDDGSIRDHDAALVWARYLWDTGRCALGSEVAARVAAEASSASEQIPAISLLGRWRVFPALERVSAQLATKPTCYAGGRELGYALGRARWLPPLVPLLRSQPFERACLAIQGALEAIMGRAESGDAARITDVLVPAARAITTPKVDLPTRQKAARFRRAVCSDLAAALAKCNARDVAESLVDEVRAELDGLDVVDGACGRAGLAPALMALGEPQQAEALLRQAEQNLEAHFDDDVDDYGVPWFDVVAEARAAASHLANWRHGMPWAPILPVSRRFSGPVTVHLFPHERAAQEAWRHAIDFHKAARQLKTAMDIVDSARAEQPDYVPWLIAHLAHELDEVDDGCAGRLFSWLAELRPNGEDRAGHDIAVAAAARALARSRRGDAALLQALRLQNPWLRLTAGIEAACALATKRETKESARSVLKELLKGHVPNGDDWMKLGRLILADLDAPQEHVSLVITMTGAESGTFPIPEQMMLLVLTLGNGLEGDVRLSANTADAVLLARGLVMETGSCRRIEAPTDSALFRPGDECYRQHPTARVFLDTSPTG